MNAVRHFSRAGRPFQVPLTLGLAKTKVGLVNRRCGDAARFSFGRGETWSQPGFLSRPIRTPAGGNSELPMRISRLSKPVS